MAECENWSQRKLSAWLKDRGLKSTGSKKSLVNRVAAENSKPSVHEGEKAKIDQSAPETDKKKSHVKYCCVPECHNTSDGVLENGHAVVLHRIPVDITTRRQWIQRLSTVRKNLHITDSTRVCSAHFVDHDKKNLPTIFPTKVRKPVVPRRHIQRKCAGHSTDQEDTPQPQEDFPDHTYAGLPELSSSVSHSEEASFPESSNTCDLYAETGNGRLSICPACQRPQAVDQVDACTQTEIHVESAHKEIGVQTSMPDITIEDLKGNDDKTRFYTGFASFQMLLVMFSNLMKHGGDRLNYWRGEQSMGERAYHQRGQKPGPRRSLRAEDEFLLTCMRLRLGLLQEHLGDIFKVSTSTVSRVLNTWINFIYDCSQKLVPWPTQEQILYNLPRAFIDFSNTQIVLDCTEIFIEKPSSVEAQWQTWSDYKHHNTMKLLIGVTPNGTVTFVSRLWGGRASDRHISMHENVLARIDPGMVVMADKGFTIEDLLPANVHLNVPPRIPSARPMTESEVFKTGHIASARIVVEMKMEQAKNYRCLQGIIPLSEIHLVEQMAFICFSWTNILPPLFKH